MNFNFEGFMGTLPIVFYGMLGIFIVIGVIFIAVNLLMYFFSPKTPRGQNKPQE